jgi:hypothetical protein
LLGKKIRIPQQDLSANVSATRYKYVSAHQSTCPEASPWEFPLAYHIVFHCYGSRLPGDACGTVRRQKNIPGTYSIPYSPSRMRINEKRMKQTPYKLDEPRRRIVLRAILEVCRFRGWRMLAAHYA